MLKLLASLFIATMPSVQAAQPTFRDIEREDMPMTRKAYAAFLRTCPNIPRAIAASSSVEVQDQTAPGNSVADEMKWNAVVQVTLTLRDGRGLMPDVLANTSSFRTALFLMGGAPNPAVIPLSPAARVICGLPGSHQHEGEDPIAVPAMAVLTTWPSDANDPPAACLDSEAHSLSEPVEPIKPKC